MTQQKQKPSFQKQIQKFKKNFEHFSKPYRCEHHHKPLNLLCIDSNCESKGLICSICLTINGSHKNHDAVQIVQYVQNCLKQIKNNREVQKDEVLDFLDCANKTYDDFLDILSSFVDNCSNIVKAYICKRSQFHEQRSKQIGSKSSNKKIIDCKFKSLQQANRLLLNLSNKYKSLSFDKTMNKQGRNKQQAQSYLNDISYQLNFIGKELKKLQVKLKQILTVKQMTPIVLNYEPFFHQPNILQNNEIIYMGETKNNVPNGKGICYYQNKDKIVFGQFIEGKLDGLAQLYYLTKDYYLGEFRNDRKNGRGVYRWFNKEYSLYEGQFRDGRRNGKGIFWWADGSKYCGSFLQGQQTGFGKLYRSGQILQYQGSWLNGLFHGKGIQYFQNGQKYQGQFKQDQFHGQGRLTKQKSTIHGVWKQNELKNVYKQKNQKQ